MILHERGMVFVVSTAGGSLLDFGSLSSLGPLVDQDGNSLKNRSIKLALPAGAVLGVVVGVAC